MKNSKKVEQITIQLKVSLDKYDQIQRLKANSEHVRKGNQEYYQYLIDRGMEAECV